MYRLGARSTRGGIVRRLPPLKASVCLGLAVATASAIRAQERGSANEWRYFGGNKAFTRYSSLAQINRANVKDLRIAWRRPAVSDQLAQAFPELRPNNYLRSTPIVIGGVLYAQNVHGLVVAFDGETGKTVWEQELFARRREEAAGSSTRGVDYWQGGSGNADRRIFAIRGEYLYALNAQTGKPIPGFGDEGRASLHFQENQPLAARFNDSTGPLVVGNVVIVTGNTAGAGDTGTFKKEAAPEDVRGFDARNGKLLWTFHVVPRPGEYGIETWGNESWKIAGDLGAWNPMTADEDLGYVYIPLTAPTASAWGVWRPGDNLFADSLVALDARTGKRVWHFQTVHHNLWEWENVGPAMLGDITVDGRRIKAVMQPNKNGFLFVLDRTNGKPVWPIEERPVPQSNVPGERTSPTQPFPTKPPAFDRQGVADTDLIDYTPELKARAREIAKEFVTGPLFTPPSITTDEPGTKRGTLMLPGSWGAANWNTGAFDPETGYYYAVSASLPGPSNRAIKKMTNPEATMEYASVGTAPDIEGLPIIKGPYGRITAMDLKTGTQVWMVANGDGPRHHPLLKDLNLPALGVPNRPAPLLTKALLFLGEGSNAVSGTPQTDWGWGRTFRAYDKATGAVIWETMLPSGTTGGPMTYMLKGKQYIVVPVGSRNEPAEYVALALP
jgi:quinoprotein glucose dehydrogenase